MKLICYVPFKLIWWTKWVNKKALKKYRGQPVILAMNHRNGFDGPEIVIDVWRKTNFWIKAELFESKFRRWFFQGMGGIPVQDNADLKLLRDTKKVLKQNHALAILPEGHRSFNTDEALQVRHGIALAALSAGVPILPLVTNRPIKPFRLTKIKVGDPIDPQQFLVDGRVTKDAVDAMAGALQQQMQNMLAGFEKKPKAKAWQTTPSIIARGLVFRDQQMLAIRRNRGGEDYYVLPGGHLEAGETIQDACVREVMEETGVTVRPFRELYKYWYIDKHDRGDGYQSFMVCDYCSGEPHETDAEEYTMPNRITGTYHPTWINVADLPHLDVRPAVLKKQLLKDLRKKGTRLPFPLRLLPNPEHRS